MKALRFDGMSLELAEVDRPRVAGEAMVRVTLSGICNTDIEIARGYAGFTGTIGHEFVGVVEGAPDRPDLVGRRVVGEINAGCGTCEKCRGGDPRHCATRTVLGIVGRDGAHAEYLSLPSRNLLAIDDEISDEKAVFIEPLAAALGVAEQVEIGADTRVAVIGDGKLGLLCAMGLTLRSKKVTLVGRHPAKMELAQPYGVQCVLSNRSEEFSGTFDVVVEASGSDSGFTSAVDLVRPRGKIILKSTFQGKPTWPVSRIVVQEITVVGSRCGKFQPAHGVLKYGLIDPTPLITEIRPLSNGVAAMSLASERGVLKVLLRP